MAAARISPLINATPKKSTHEKNYSRKGSMVILICCGSLVPPFSSAKSSVPGQCLNHFLGQEELLGVIKKPEGPLNEYKNPALVYSFMDEDILSGFKVLKAIEAFCSISDVSMSVHISRKCLFTLHAAIKRKKKKKYRKDNFFRFSEANPHRLGHLHNFA